MIKAGFVIDNSLTYTPEEEVKGILEDLAFMDLHNIEVLFAERGMTKTMMETHLDLLIIDYGGASLMGASELARGNVITVCEYAQEHEGCFVAIWTQHTRYVYEGELQERFGHLSNIFVRYPESSWVDDADAAFVAAIQAWFAADVETREERVEKLLEPGRKTCRK